MSGAGSKRERRRRPYGHLGDRRHSLRASDRPAAFARRRIRITLRRERRRPRSSPRSSRAASKRSGSDASRAWPSWRGAFRRSLRRVGRRSKRLYAQRHRWARCRELHEPLLGGLPGANDVVDHDDDADSLGIGWPDFVGIHRPSTRTRATRRRYTPAATTAARSALRKPERTFCRLPNFGRKTGISSSSPKRDVTLS